MLLLSLVGFMYIRYTQPPGDLFDWYEPYLQDEEEIDPKAGGGGMITIGQMVRQFLVKLDWFSTLFPRIPVPIQKQIQNRLAEYSREHKIDFDDRGGSNAPAPPRQSGSSGGNNSSREERRDYRERSPLPAPSRFERSESRRYRDEDRPVTRRSRSPRRHHIERAPPPLPPPRRVPVSRSKSRSRTPPPPRKHKKHNKERDRHEVVPMDRGMERYERRGEYERTEEKKHSRRERSRSHEKEHKREKHKKKKKHKKHKSREREREKGRAGSSPEGRRR